MLSATWSCKADSVHVCVRVRMHVCVCVVCDVERVCFDVMELDRQDNRKWLTINVFD